MVGVLATAVNAYVIVIFLLPFITSPNEFLVKAPLEKHVRLVGEEGSSDLILAMDGDCTVSCKRLEAFVVPSGQDLNRPEAALLVLRDVRGMRLGKVASRSVRVSFCGAWVQHYAIPRSSSHPDRGKWKLLIAHHCSKKETMHLTDQKSAREAEGERLR